jgi:nucleoside-diphosphate-sugar epimerase
MTHLARSPDARRILVTGATGYVGARLRSRLEAAGHRVRCMARRPESLETRVGPAVEVVLGDVLCRLQRTNNGDVGTGTGLRSRVSTPGA